MVITFTKLKYEDIPQQVAEAVLKFTEKEVQFDETQLTQGQIDKIAQYLTSRGYKQV